MKAVVRDLDGNTTTIESEYETKQKFRQDLKRNGYTVIGRIEQIGENTRKTRLYDLGTK